MHISVVEPAWLLTSRVMPSGTVSKEWWSGSSLPLSEFYAWCSLLALSPPLVQGSGVGADVLIGPDMDLFIQNIVLGVLLVLISKLQRFICEGAPYLWMVSVCSLSYQGPPCIPIHLPSLFFCTKMSMLTGFYGSICLIIFWSFVLRLELNFIGGRICSFIR